MNADDDRLWEVDVKLEKFDEYESEVPLTSIDFNMVKKESEAGLHECKFCKMIYSSNSNLERHIRHVHVSKIKCSVCDMDVLKKYYRHHLKKVHGLLRPKPERNDENENRCNQKRGKSCEQDGMTPYNDIPQKEKSSEDDKSMMLFYNGVECQICYQLYSNKINLKKHVYNVHRMVRVKCDLCDKEVNKKSLNRHIRNIHRTKPSFRKEKKRTPDEEKIPCTVCGKRCSNPVSLDNHIRTVHKEEQYKCVQCDFQGIRKQLDKHIRKEHNEEVYQCGRCHKILKSKSTLKEHMWIHTDHRRFICDVCGMRFKRTSNYYGHMKSHQEKKFQCRICGNFFLRKRYLAMHEQTIHNYYGEGVPPQEKGYQCEICGVKLKWKNNLLAHMRIHTGEKPYKCKICSEDFTCHGSLRTHMAKHSVCRSGQEESNVLILQAYLGNRLDATTSDTPSSNNRFSLRVDSSELEILDSGLSKLKRNDVLMRFFVTVKHHGAKSRSVYAHMIECCENLFDEDLDCESFRLYEDYFRIPPGITRNLTLVHPNIYVYNRKGFCLISIWHRIVKEEKQDDKPVQMRIRIVFDTNLRQAPQEVPHVLQDFYNPKAVLKCDSKDLDPFDDCTPVDCYLKYSGFRNYYNPRRKMCQKVPVCNADTSKELADVVYEPYSNMCRDLEKTITEDDILELINGEIKEPDPEMEMNSINIQCHHGQIDVKTGLCICDYGWKSERYDPVASTPIYHMCNVQCHKPGYRYPLIPFSIGILMAFWFLLCVCFCEKYHFACGFMDKVPYTSPADCSCLQYSVQDGTSGY